MTSMIWDMGKLKGLLGISQADVDRDIPLQFIMDYVDEVVTNYCNLPEVPDGLITTCYRMAMDLYRAAGIGEADAPLFVSSLKEGDTVTSFGSMLSVVSDSVLNDYRAQLNRYRKLRW